MRKGIVYVLVLILLFSTNLKAFSLEDEDIYEGIYIDNKLKD